MKRLWIIMSLIAILGITGVVMAASGYSLEWWTVDNGGGASAGAGYSLNGAIGQPDAGGMSVGGYRLEGGYWGGNVSGEVIYRIYLPLIRRD